MYSTSTPVKVFDSEPLMKHIFFKNFNKYAEGKTN